MCATDHTNSVAVLLCGSSGSFVSTCTNFTCTSHHTILKDEAIPDRAWSSFLENGRASDDPRAWWEDEALFLVANMPTEYQWHITVIMKM